jgi:hypothetical protein
MAHIWIVLLYVISYSFAQQCDQSSDVGRFDCYPENNASEAECLARQCCWRAPVESLNLPTMSPDVDVPYCYYPKDFPNYAIKTNEPTAFGQRITIVKTQATYMPNEILSLTVDLIFETTQRIRIRIYDPTNKRYEVPIPVPTVETKANVTDYIVSLNQSPFAIIIIRKSTGSIL